MAAIAVVVFVALDFVNKLRTGETTCSGCGHSNYCIARMYTLEMKCNRCVEGLPASLRREIDKAEKRWKDTR